jgi:outer membrane lipoprotein-sorting protein
MRILKQLEASGEQFTTIEAKLTYTVEDRKLGDVEERTGFVAYEKKSKDAPAKFRVTFDTLRQGEGPRIREQEDFAFDGQWVTLRKHKIKQMTRGQVAGEGEQVEPLRLGKGMFPLPFGQKAADVLEFFDVSQGPEDADASGNADCLILTPRREKAEDVSFSEMRMWIDRSTHLPVKMITRDDKKKVTTVVFGDIRTNQPLAADIFDLPRPAGWELRVEDWRKKAD